MNRLSQRFSRWYGTASAGATDDIPGSQVVIVGSGYGGSVAALRYAELGYEVTVLERGSEFVPGEFPADMSALPTFFRVNNPTGTGVIGRSAGLLNWHVGLGMAAMTGNGLGGGSLINAGILMQPVDDVFGLPQWPAAIGKTGARDDADLDQCFDLARKTLLKKQGEQSLADAKVNSSDLNRSDAFRDMATRCGLAGQVSSVQATIDPARCIQCGDCMTGCNVPGAKLTLTDTYLAHAVELGANILCGADVQSVERNDDNNRWQLHVSETEHSDLKAEPGHPGKTTRLLSADIVVISAGTFGSTEILQRSRERHGLPLSQALGTRLSANGDSITVVANYGRHVSGNRPKPVHAVSRSTPLADRATDIGPTITLAMDMRDEGPLETQLLVEDGACPAPLARAFDALVSTQWVSQGLDRLKSPALTGREFNGMLSDVMGAPSSLGDQSQILLTMGHDGSAGRIMWMPELNRAIPVWSSPQKLTTYRTQQALFRRMNKSLKEARHLHNPLWQMLPESAGAMQGGLPDPMITTVHPLGGCVMGDNFASAVVNERGQVRRSEDELHDGLFVLDGSIIPTSLGCNPLLTITALAEFAMRSVKPPPVEATRKAGRRFTPDTAQALPVETRPDKLPTVSAVFYERLVCASLRPGPELADALGLDNKPSNAEMILGFGHHDWDAAMSGTDHELSRITGTLKIQNHATPSTGSAGDDEPVIEYQLSEGQGTEDRSRFIILSGTAVDPSLNALHRRIYRFLLGLPTWLVQRLIPDFIRSRQLSRAGLGSKLLRAHGTETSNTLRNTKLARDAVRLLWNASEARQMRYQLRFEPVAGQPGSAQLPQLWITGHKQVQYCATPGELLRYSADLTQRLWRWYRGKPAADTYRSVALKRSYIEQVSNPRIDFHLEPPKVTRWSLLSSRPAASGDFQMDPYSVMQDKPPQIGQDGDLTSAIATLSGYPALFARFALKTRLFDFRAPDYSGRIYRDDSPAEETTLFNRPEQPVEGHLAPEAIDLEVERGYHAAEDDRFARQKVTLRLWRYRQTDSNTSGAAPVTPFSHGRHNGRKVLRARCVLLMHAFSQSGLTYTFNTTRKNLAEAFIEQGYEVWLLESRMSTRLGLCDQPSTVDQIARFDVPGAVDRITAMLRDEYRQHGVLADDEQVQIGCFGQCIGSASLAMSLLDGQLNHPGPDDAPPLSKLWSCMFSQVHPVTIGARESQAKSWIPPVLRLATTTVPFAVRGPVNNPVEALTDRVLAALPVPVEETCPEHSDFSADEDNVATCRRIRFIEAPLFKHCNVNTATHRILNRLFGNANLTLFAHARRFVDYELLVDENGVNRYVTTENIRQNMAMPVAFLHGTVNELFDPDSARRSLEIVRNVHPYWIGRFAPEVIPADGYGHIDLLIGTNADVDVYPRITGFFDSVLRTEDQDDSFQENVPKSLTELRYPRIGPTLGWTRLDDSNDLLCRVSGVVQMNSRAAIQSDASGTTAWAYVHGMLGKQDEVQKLEINRSSARTHVAWGDVRIKASRVAPGASTLRIHIVVLHDIGHWAERSKLAREDLVRLMWHQRRQARAARRKMQAPIPSTHSRRYSTHPGSASSFAGTEAVWRRPVVIRRTVIDHLLAPPKRQAVVIGCCRYPGLGMDRIRADESFSRVLQLLDDGPPAVEQTSEATQLPDSMVYQPGPSRAVGNNRDEFEAPGMALMLGDQIYADATAGLVDPATPVERYTERYESAFGVGKSPQMARLLRTLPVMMTPDDHEYHNGFPHEPSSAAGDHEAAIDMARSTLDLFQSIFNPNGQRGNYAFDHGLIRFCVLDTRSDRSEDPVTGQIRITAPGTMQWLEEQLAGTGPDRFVCICSGSVVLPGLRDDGSPSNPIAVREGFEVARNEQRELLQLCVTHAAGRFALVSGDYHLGSVVELGVDGQIVGCAIVAPPFYAPFRYINAQPYELLEHDTIDLGANGQLDVSPGSGPDGNPARCDGSGFGLIQVEQHEGNWQVRVGMQLNQYERFTGWGPLQCVASIDLQK